MSPNPLNLMAPLRKLISNRTCYALCSDAGHFHGASRFNPSVILVIKMIC